MSKLEAVTEAIVPQEDRFVPLAVLRTAVRFWWFVSLMVVAGGLVGWLFHLSRPPVYEAVAHFSTTLDYVRTGPLTQFEEDTAINLVGDIIYSNEIVQKVIDQAAAEGIYTSVLELKKATVLERRVNVWDLRVRNTNPQVAERLANIWVEQGQAALLDGYQHTLQADRWDRYLRSLESCLAKAAASEPSGGQCSTARFSEIQDDIRDAGAALYQERLAARGLFPGINIGPIEHAAVSSGPVLFNRNQLVLAGCFIGLLLGIGIVQWGGLERLPVLRLANRPERS